jgi:hypothetical protein
VFSVLNHGLVSGQRIFFTQPIATTASGTTTNLVSATTKLVTRPYWVKVLTPNTFVIANSLANYTGGSFIARGTGTLSTLPTIFYTQVLGRGLTNVSFIELLTLPMVRGRKYEFDSNAVFNAALDAATAPSGVAVTDPAVSIFLNNSAVILGEDQITPYGEDLTSATLSGWLPALNLVNPTATPTALIANAYCSPTVDQFFQPEAYLVPAIDVILAGDYDASATGTTGPVLTVNNIVNAGPYTNGTYFNIALGGGSPGASGAQATVVIAGGIVTSVSITAGGNGYVVGDTLTVGAFAGATCDVATISAAGVVAAPTTYATQAGVVAVILFPLPQPAFADLHGLSSLMCSFYKYICAVQHCYSTWMYFQDLTIQPRSIYCAQS